MPSWKELKRYCDRDGWELYKVTDHYYYRKVLPNGTILRTKVSKNPGQIRGHLWQEILKKQLQTTMEAPGQRKTGQPLLYCTEGFWEKHCKLGCSRRVTLGNIYG